MNVTSVVVNDLHCGSRHAVMSDEAYNSESDRVDVSMTRHQEILWEEWKELTKKWKGCDKLIVNGDLVDGLQSKSKISPCWSTNLQDQMDDCVKLLEMFEAKKIYVIRGTPFHTHTLGFDVEERIAEELDAVTENDVIGEDGTIRRHGMHSTMVKLINFAPQNAPEKIMHVAHHLRGSMWFSYRGTPLVRDLVQTMLSESDWVDRRYRKVFGIIRGHAHYYWWAESPHRVMLINPAWQIMTPFDMKISPSSMANLGATRFTFNDDGTFSKETHHIEMKFRPIVHDGRKDVEVEIKHANER